MTEIKVLIYILLFMFF